ncbi:MAG: ABC transporter permease [Eubacteriales bacterium]|nr:ABC transporter permease [Eubacteriales bacterium]MCI6633277.1 ABC transporter permease [Clostridiales bacterium]MCI6962037.1 ABC transporter permease [Clostridiales bacterium]MDD5909315.1 ABC transporter permease [Clostridiales bacterium]MDD7003977.1 ABC transporter permease [Clostridiales bacterium]
MVKKLRNFFRGTYLGLMLIFLYAPILVLMVFSFNGSKSMARWTGFSFKWYEALMHDSTIMNALMVTLSVAVISALVATFIGTFAAIGIHSMKKRPRAVVENISRLPMVNPDLVTGISFMMLFAAMGIKGGYTRMLIAHITFNIPYVIFSVMPKLRQSSNLLYEAAMDLGCTPMMAIRKVVIPDIMPGIVSGFVLAFTLSLDDFVVSWFATDGIQNLSIYIYGIARRGISPKINALCTIMFVVVVALLVFINLKSINEERAAETQRKKLSITR